MQEHFFMFVEQALIPLGVKLGTSESWAGAVVGFAASLLAGLLWRRGRAWWRGDKLPIRPLAELLLKKLERPELWQPYTADSVNWIEIPSARLSERVWVRHSDFGSPATAKVGDHEFKGYFNRRERRLIDARVWAISRGLDAVRNQMQENKITSGYDKAMGVLGDGN